MTQYNSEGINPAPNGISSIADSTLFPTNTPIGVGIYVISRGRIYWSVPVGKGDIAGTGNDWKSDPDTASPQQRTIPTWYIDSVAGSDDNSGVDAAHALLTTDELQNRWGGDAYPLISTVVTVNFVNMPPVTSLRCRRLNETCGLIISGVVVASLVTTVGAFTSVNYATKTWAQLTSPGVADWTPLVGKRLNFAGGSLSFIAKVNPHSAGLTVARIGVPYADGNPRTWGAAVVPANGSSLTIETLPSCEHLNIEVLGGSLQFPNNVSFTTPAIRLLGIATTKSSVLVTDWGNFSQHVYGCDLTDFDARCPAIGSSHPVACRLNYNDGRVPQIFSASGCVLASAFTQLTFLPSAGAHDCIFQDCLFQSVGVNYYDGVYITHRGVGFFDVIGDAVNVKDASFLSNVINMTGDDISGYGMSVDNATVMDSGGNTLTLSGVSGDWHFTQGPATGGFLWSDIPQSQRGMAGLAQLVPGTPSKVTVTSKNLPSDAVVQPSYVTPGATPGALGIANRVANGFDITSTVTTDASSVAWSWTTTGKRLGHVFTR